MYQILGFSPFSIPSKLVQSSSRIKWYIYNGVLIIFYTSLVLYNVIFYQIFLEGAKGEMLTYLSFVIITAVRTLTIIIIIESTVNREKQIRFLKQFDDIDSIFHDELATKMNYKMMRRNAFFWLVIWLIKMFVLFTLVLTDILEDDITVWDKFLWILVSIPVIVSVVRYFQIIHYIQLLGYHFELINTRLNEIYASINRLSVCETELNNNNYLTVIGSIEDGIYDEIVALRRIFHTLWESTGLLNETFRWSLLFLIATSFVIILVNLYRVLCWLFINPDPDQLYFVVLFTTWSGGHVFYFIKISSACHHISQEVRRNIFYKN